jgi:hypothetical protein
MHHPSQRDDGGHEEDGGEEEARVRHPERRGMVVRGVVILRAALDPMRWVKDRRAQHQDRGGDHEQAEHHPLGMGGGVVKASLLD